MTTAREDILTSQAIAELMREMQEQNGLASTSNSHLQERKINPLGKTNKRFLGRTINTMLRHNKREGERTQANCQLKLRELDERWERRKVNAYYNDRDSHSSSRSRSRQKRKDDSSSSCSDSRSRSRSRKRHKKKHKKHKKSKSRRRERSPSSSSSDDGNQVEVVDAETDFFRQQSNNMALAVAMAYNQVCLARASKAYEGMNGTTKSPSPRASPTSDVDIIKELMSEDDKDDIPIELSSSGSSSDDNQKVHTIEVSSSSDSEEDTEDEEPVKPTERCADICITLDDSAKEEEEEDQHSRQNTLLPSSALKETIDLTDD